MVEKYQENPEVLGFRLGHVPLGRKAEVNLVPPAHFQGLHSSLIPCVVLSSVKSSDTALREWLSEPMRGMLESMITADFPFRDSNTKGNEGE